MDDDWMAADDVRRHGTKWCWCSANAARPSTKTIVAWRRSPTGHDVITDVIVMAAPCRINALTSLYRMTVTVDCYKPRIICLRAPIKLTVSTNCSHFLAITLQPIIRFRWFFFRWGAVFHTISATFCFPHAVWASANCAFVSSPIDLFLPQSEQLISVLLYYSSVKDQIRWRHVTFGYLICWLVHVS